MKEGDIKKIDSGDFYIIKGKKVGNDDPTLFFNYTTKEYDLTSHYRDNSLTKGIVEIYKNGRIKYGTFIRNKFKNITIVLHNGDQWIGVDYELVRNNYSYRENTSNGYFYYYKSINAKDFKALRSIQRQEKNNLPYNLNGPYLKEFQEEYNKTEIVPREGIEAIANNLNGLTFGFEFETTMGFVPPRLLGAVGITPLRDGSIGGIEYATIPLGGEKGVEALCRGVEMLADRTVHDNSCSMHLHLGGVPRTKKFILAMFLFANIIQDDLFDHFPITKRYNWRIKNKNYNKPYDPLKTYSRYDKNSTLANNFDTLMAFLTDGNHRNGVNMSDIRVHPQDPDNNRKWNIRARYYWLNFIPLIFGNKKTIEFRIHTPIMDVNKILSYLVLCSSMVNYVKRNADSILAHPNHYVGLKIETVLYDACLSSKISGTKYVNAIAKYWQNRKSKTIIQNSQGLVIGNEDAITMFEVLKRSRLGAAVYAKQKKTFKQAVQEEQAIQRGQGPRNDFYVHTNSVPKNKWAEMKANLEPKKMVSPYRSPSNKDGIDQKMLDKAKKRLMDTRGRIKSLETLESSILESRSGKEALRSANEQLRLAESNLDKELRFKARHPERYNDYKKTEGVISNQVSKPEKWSENSLESLEDSLATIKMRRRGISPEAKTINSPPIWDYGDINTGASGTPTISSTSGHTSYKSYTATLKSGIDPINDPEGTEPTDKLPF